MRVVKYILNIIIVAAILLITAENAYTKPFHTSVSKDFYIDTESILADFETKQGIAFDDDFVYLKSFRPIYMLSSRNLKFFEKKTVEKSYIPNVPSVYNLSFKPMETKSETPMALTVKSEPKTKSIEELMGKINKLTEERNFQAANTLYEEVIQNYPKRFETYHKYGLSLISSKNYHKAIYAFTQATALNPDYAPSYYFLGNVYFQLKDYNNALKQYLKATKINPYSLDSYYKIALTLEKIDNKPLAAQYYSKCLTLDADYKPAQNAIVRLASN